MDVGTLVAHLKVKGTEAVTKSLTAVEKNADKIGDKLTAIGKVTALAGVAGGAIALTGAISQASGALIALPAAGMAAGAVMATLKTGTFGVSDALKALASGDAAKAAEAMGKLSPNARLAVTAMDGVRKSFLSVRTAVQDQLFRGLSTEISSLGGTYMPILKNGLTQNAAALNSWAMSAMNAAKSPFVSGAVASVLGQTAMMMQTSSGSAGSMVTILAALAQAGMPLLNLFAGFVTRNLAAAAAFLSSAQGAAWLTAKVNLARTILAALGTIVANVARFLGSMFTAGNSQGSLLLGTLVRLTGAMAAWGKSAEGQQQMKDMFSVLGQVLQNLLIILPPISGAFMTLMSFIGSLPGPVQSIVTGFGSFALVAGLLLPKIIGVVGTLRTIGGAISSGLSFVTLAAARWGLMGTAAATSAGAQNASALRIVGSWLLMAARSTASALVTAAAWTLSTAGAAAAAVGRMVATAALMVAQWAMMAAGAMARAVIMAASWFIALGPIGWVIAAVVGLVALVIANWDTVKGWTLAAWSAVSGAVSTATSAVVGFVSSCVAGVLAFFGQLAALPGKVGAWFGGMVSAAAARGAALLSWAASLPGRILSALASLGSLLVGLGGDMVRGLWNGIQAGWSWLTGMVRNLASTLLSAAKSALGIGSPSKEMRDEVGRWIPAGMAVGIRADGRQVGKAVAAVSRQATAGMSARAVGGSRAGALNGAGGATVIRIDPADIDRIVGAAAAAGDRPIELDGKKVTRGVQKRESLERRLVATTRR